MNTLCDPRMVEVAQRPLYRKEALETLASPEELDRLMQITRPGSWLLLAGFGGVLLMILVWGVFGRLTTPLEQSGILALSNPIAFVSAPAAGSVAAISVQPDDVIVAGAPLGSITTAEGSVSVTSPVAGRVIAVRVAVGSPVDSGTPLISVAAAASTAPQAVTQEVIVFVPLEDRQRIRAGMDAQILPSTVERETYGYLEGEVLSVAEFAATPEEMRAVLGDAALPETSGPLFEVRVSLKTTASGAYRWTASTGPASPVVLGTPCLVRITIDSERPISKVFNLGYGISRR